MTEKQLVCIACPVGCRLTATIENNKVIKVTGNTCKRGEIYANDECIAPKRTLTTTVLAQYGAINKPVSVKTNKPIPKELIFKAMNEVNKQVITEKLPIGSVIIKDILGTGCDLVLTQEM